MMQSTHRFAAAVSFAIAALAGLSVVGQAGVASAKESGGAPVKVGQAQGANVISIAANTQVTIEDRIRIAAYNVRDESYKDDAGKDATRLSAALQLSVKDDAAQEQKLRVHVGQTFSVGGKSFEVTSVEKRLVKLSLK